MSENSIVKPEVIFVDDILKDIERGMLRVPAFQRNYVWQPKQVIELFDSIFHGYPIGSVLLWETDIKMRDFNVFTLDKYTNKNSNYYIVDGQQRLTTLYHCLTKNKGENGLWDVYADLITGKFVHLNKNEIPKNHYFSLKKIRSTSDFIKECTRLMEHQNSDDFIEKAEYLSDTLRKYKLSVIKMVGGDLEEAIEIFTRLNRTGLEILPFDIVNALNYVDEGRSPFNDLRKQMKEYVDECGFFSSEKNESLFESEIYLKLVRISSGFQLYGNKDTIKLSEHCKSSDFELKTELMFEALKETLIFLKEKLYFFRFSDLPYTNLFYMLYKYFYSQIQLGNQINVRKVKFNFYMSTLAGLPNGSPSVTEKVLDFYGNDFDLDELTKKLIKDFSNENLIDGFVSGILSGTFSATSASSKVLFNIISNCYFNANGILHEIDYLKYPPLNLFSDSKLKGRLGNKFFFIKSYFEGEKSLMLTPPMSNDNEEVVTYRENELAKLAKLFFDDLALS